MGSYGGLSSNMAADDYLFYWCTGYLVYFKILALVSVKQ